VGDDDSNVIEVEPTRRQARQIRRITTHFWQSPPIFRSKTLEFFRPEFSFSPRAQQFPRRSAFPFSLPRSAGAPGCTAGNPSNFRGFDKGVAPYPFAE
jgi:hypothetical protein